MVSLNKSRRGKSSSEIIIIKVDFILKIFFKQSSSMQSVISCANFSLIIFFHKKMLLIKFLVEFTFISKEFCTQTNISCVFNLAHTLKRTSFTLKFLERKKNTRYETMKILLMHSGNLKVFGLEQYCFFYPSMHRRFLQRALDMHYYV